MDQRTIDEIAGARELVSWFGSFPSFHDAHLTEFSVSASGECILKLKAWRMTNQVDADGFFVLDKKFDCVVRFDGVTSMKLENFQPGAATVFGLQIQRGPDGFEARLESSYGVEADIHAQTVSLEFTPEVAAP